MLLQELVPGATEWSASLLLLRDGEVAAIAAVEYTYDAAEYVWPHARERKVRVRARARAKLRVRVRVGARVRVRAGACKGGTSHPSGCGWARAA
jgi:hypothetical protein